MDLGKNATQLSLEGMPPRFGPGFLKDHAGKILTDPKIAIIEIIANCWDAGADLVDITWPDTMGDEITISDNGIGMTYDEFSERWNELSYNRRDKQGVDVIFPPGNQKSSRKAFGRNGKGRHGMFCFDNEYFIYVTKNGEQNVFRVYRSNDIQAPYSISHVSTKPCQQNGVVLSAKLVHSFLNVSEVKDLIGSKFVADPCFRIKINGEFVELTDLEHLCDNYTLDLDGLGVVYIRHFDTRKTGRTSKQNGIAWWVNKRLVGEATWKGFDDVPYLDARKSEAKRHTFVVEADILQDSVEADWDGFIETETFKRVSEEVRRFIASKLDDLFSDMKRTRKIDAIKVNKSNVKDLPLSSRKMIGTFLERIQLSSPTIRQQDLDATVAVLANLEKSRSQYSLLEQLAKLNPDDLDGLNLILSRWTISEASLVLDILGKRLKLIDTLEKLVEDPTSDELHQIQPLFESGLWIFGPEYESIEFIANKTLLTVVRDFLQDSRANPSTPKRRPDIVVLPDPNIGVYSADSFDDRSEVNGYSKILIIELKRGGFTISTDEMRQCEDYARQLRKNGKVGTSTKITGYVLGANIDKEIGGKSTQDDEKTVIYPKTYSIVLREAHARTFNLLEKIRRVRVEKGIIEDETDPEVEEVLNQTDQLSLIAESVDQ